MSNYIMIILWFLGAYEEWRIFNEFTPKAKEIIDEHLQFIPLKNQEKIVGVLILLIQCFVLIFWPLISIYALIEDISQLKNRK